MNSRAPDKRGRWFLPPPWQIGARATGSVSVRPGGSPHHTHEVSYEVAKDDMVDRSGSYGRGCLVAVAVRRRQELRPRTVHLA